MINKYEKLFQNNMTSAQMAILYFSLCDRAKVSGNLEQLDNAFRKAFIAKEREESDHYFASLPKSDKYIYI